MGLFTSKLDQLRLLGRYRSLRLPAGIDLTSNDYLGIASDGLLQGKARALLDAGVSVGAGGSRLLGGNMEEHESLEAMAAEFFGFDRALYFATGFQANYALFTTICSRHDVIIYDEFLHASARDGIASSSAKSVRVGHSDLGAFEEALKVAHEGRRADGQIWVAVESVYSMDGDQAPLAGLYDLAQKYEAVLIVDEAHATGVLGAEGRGLSHGLGEGVIALHACGKALGVAGGLLCASVEVIDYMINAARPFVFSTAPMPLQAALVEESLKLVASPEGQARRDSLSKVARYVKLNMGSEGEGDRYIVPLIIGEDARAVEVAEALQAHGFDIRAVRPPTVPEGTARLRFSLSAALDEVTLDRFFNVYNDVMKREAA